MWGKNHVFTRIYILVSHYITTISTPYSTSYSQCIPTVSTPYFIVNSQCLPSVSTPYFIDPSHWLPRAIRAYFLFVYHPYSLYLLWGSLAAVQTQDCSIRVSWYHYLAVTNIRCKWFMIIEIESASIDIQISILSLQLFVALL